MGVITLTTDFQKSDYYIGIVKGALYTLCPEAKIVDITHDIPAYNISKAAYIIKNSYSHFPEGPVHIIGVSSEATVEFAHLVVKYDNHYFVGSDTGIFSLIFGDLEPEEVIELNVSADSNRLSFPTKDIFVKVAAHIQKGGTISVLGRKIDGVLKKIAYQPYIDNNQLKGMVMHIDSFGNAITNISEILFNNFVKNYGFSVVFRNSDYDINRISYTYSDVAEGEKLALFNTTNHLEIAINKGRADKLLGLRDNDLIRIELHDS